MSSPNVETFWKAVDAYHRRDAEGFCGLCSPEVEFHPITAAVEGGYRGHEGVTEWFERVDATMEDVRLQVDEVRDLGERLVAVGRFGAVGKSSRARIDTEIGWVVEYREGRMLHWWTYPHHADALAAAGLAEQEA